MQNATGFASNGSAATRATLKPLGTRTRLIGLSPPACARATGWAATGSAVTPLGARKRLIAISPSFDAGATVGALNASGTNSAARVAVRATAKIKKAQQRAET